MKTLQEATHMMMNLDGSKESSIRIREANDRFAPIIHEARSMPELDSLINAILVGFLEHNEPKVSLWQAFLTGLHIGIEMEKE